MSITMDSEWEVDTCQVTIEFVEQELCGLKARYIGMEQDLKNTCIELTHAFSQ